MSDYETQTNRQTRHKLDFSSLKQDWGSGRLSLALVEIQDLSPERNLDQESASPISFLYTNAAASHSNADY